MSKLNKPQRDLLDKAAEAEGGAVDAANAPKAASSLIRRGLMISVPQADGGSRLLITEAGRAALAPEKEPSLPAPATSLGKGKLQTLIELLQRPGGVELKTLMNATGWQAHSVRGAMAGAIKKRGLQVVSEKTDAGRVYRISAGAGA